MRILIWGMITLFFSLPLQSYTQESIPNTHSYACRYWVLSWSPRIFLIENFLSYAECDYLIEQARPHLTPSTVVVNSSETVAVHPGRTSEGMFFPQNSSDPIVRHIEAKIAMITMLPEENGEGLQVLHYNEEGEYLPHYDFFDPSTEGGRVCYNRGGQRLATVFIYLNNPENGGETFFPEGGINIRPMKGNAVIVHNCTPNGLEDPLSLHGGAPVIKGEKWLAIKWIRQNAFE